MNTTVGVLDPPLGNIRLQIVKLMSALLSKATSAIAAEIVVLDMFSTLIVWESLSLAYSQYPLFLANLCHSLSPQLLHLSIFPLTFPSLSC